MALIVISFDGKRVLFSEPPRKFYMIHVSLHVSNPAILPPFTGKVVKSLLIKGNPDLEKVFKSSTPGYPKPIHITPLGYRRRDKSVVFLWKKDRSRYIEAKPGRQYFFIVSCSEDVSTMVLDSIMEINGVKLFNTEWSIDAVTASTHDLPSSKPLVRLDNAKSVKIMFRTPVQPIDPYKKTIYKRMNILPGILLGYNAGEITRMYKRGPEYWRILDILNYVLTESITYWKTVKPIEILYDNKLIPTLTGYVKYWITLDGVDENSKILIENILSHAAIMGVGSSRSIGLGHIEIKVEH